MSNSYSYVRKVLSLLNAFVEVMKEDLLAEITACEPYTVSELADLLDAPRRTVRYHLDALAEAGELHKKKHSPRNVSFWREE